MKKVLPIGILVAMVIAGGIYYFTNKSTVAPVSQNQQNLPAQASSTTAAAVTFKTFTDQETGFTIEYPSHYSVEAEAAPRGAWGTRTLLTISDGVAQTSKTRAMPVTVTLQKQPVGADGKIYHTIADYTQSGTAAQMVQGATNPSGDLVTINGMQALLYHFPPSESTGIAGDSYFFIKNDLLYEVGFNPNDPYKDQMLQSISWK